MLVDEFSGTVGVDGGAGGVGLAFADNVLDWVLGLSRDWLDVLLVVPELEDSWLVGGCLDEAG